MATEQLYTTLNTGAKMPLLGLGTYNMNGNEAVEAVQTAIEIGYRLIDTATMYGNEKEIGKGIRESGVKREDLFVTTKVNNSDQGYDNALRAFETSMKSLDIEYIDLYLVHWPIKNKRKDTWRALEHLFDTKQVKAIGVANYLLPFLKELETYSNVTPAVNQMEFSAYLYMKDELEYCKQHNIQLQAYTPLTKGEKFDDPKLVKLANQYGKTPAQMLLRWDVQHGVSAIPKSSHAKRLSQNFNIFDFEISEEDMKTMNALNEGLRLVGDPMQYL